MTADTRPPPLGPAARTSVLLVGGVVVLAALARLVFLALHPPIDDRLYDYDAMVEIRTTWWVTHLCLAAPGFPLAFGGFGALVATLCLRAGRGGTAALVGAFMVGAGGLLAGIGFAAEAATWAYLTDPAVVSPADGPRAFDGVAAHPGLIDTPILTGFALLVVGTVVLLAALWRSGTVPRWVPISGIGVALVTQAPWPDALRAVPAVLDTAVLVGISLLAVRRLRADS